MPEPRVSLPRNELAVNWSSICRKHVEKVSEPRPFLSLQKVLVFLSPCPWMMAGFLRAQEVLRTLRGSCLCSPSKPPTPLFQKQGSV